jgi:hypothetical protein
MAPAHIHRELDTKRICPQKDEPIDRLLTICFKGSTRYALRGKVSFSRTKPNHGTINGANIKLNITRRTPVRLALVGPPEAQVLQVLLEVPAALAL